MRFPARFSLASLPTPLQELRRLRDALGGERACPRIFIKRDDLTGLAFGGNKARKLEFIVADALRKGATALITTGAAQSNHARMTAAAAVAAGLDCVLVLTTVAPEPELTGNLLIDRVLGAEIHLVPAGDDPKLPFGNDTAKAAELEQELKRKGGVPYVIATGGSTGVGALGYVAGTLELVTQLVAAGLAPDYLYFASGSRGTQAGLTLGARLLNVSYSLVGIAVSGGEAEKVVRTARIANEAAEMLGVSPRISETEVATDQSFIGAGYGIPTPGCLEAIAMLARTEGILLDPVYTGKAMAGLIDHARKGRLRPDHTVVFLHTGGAAALPAHAEALRNL